VEKPIIKLNSLTYFLIAMLLFASMTIVIKAMAGGLDTFQIVFVRNVFSCCLLLPIIFHHGFKALKPANIRLHLSRAFVGLVAMQTWFYSVINMPVGNATALSFTTPLFATIFAVLLLGERVGKYRIIALIIGFIGVFIIANPNASDFTWVSFVALFSSLTMAIAGILVKKLTSIEPSWRIVFYMSFNMMLISAIPAYLVWNEPTFSQLISILAIATCSTSAQFCMATALRNSEMSRLMPFEFMRLIFTAILAHLFLSETISINAIIGGIVILASIAFL
jgi:drug/metabolite transporter (DMT)-like permease